MISYWNEYYRDKGKHYKDYIGQKLFIQCFGYTRSMERKIRNTRKLEIPKKQNNINKSIYEKNESNTYNTKCCQTCRYGNYCPFGDNEDEIFCLNGFDVKNKEDVCNLTEFSEKGESIRIERSRKLLDHCEKYKPINHKKYYTYNDFGI